jgi:hypothetical protein
MSFIRPPSQSVLIVGEPEFTKAMEAWLSDRDASEDKPKTWTLNPNGATVSDLFDSVTAPRPDGSGLNYKSLPLALWPLFEEIWVQRDWDVVSRNETFDDTLRQLFNRSDNRRCEWWWLAAEDPLSFDDSGSFPSDKKRRLEQDDVERQVSLPAGAMLCGMLRHEYSMRNARNRIHCCSCQGRSKNGEMSDERVIRQLLGFLGAGFRDISHLHTSDLKSEPTDSEQQGHCTRDELRKARLLQRLLSAAWIQSVWKQLRLPAKDLAAPAVVFCDDKFKSLVQIREAFLDEPQSAEGASSADQHSLYLTRLDGRTCEPDEPIRPIKYQTTPWDTEIAEAFTPSHDTAASAPTAPAFVVCDYDLDGGTAPEQPKGHSLTGAKLAALVKGHLSNSKVGSDRTVSAITFTGGHSPVIARESIELGCDFFIRKAAASGNHHAAVDVDGLASLSLWIGTVTALDRYLRDFLEALRQNGLTGLQIIEGLECACRATIQRELAIPRSLEPLLQRVRARAMDALSRSDRKHTCKTQQADGGK